MIEELISGIYVIERVENGQKYVGQGEDVNFRMKRPHGECDALYNAITKYGKKAFKRYVVEYCSIEELDDREIFWIKELHAHVSEGGYNISWGGGAFFRGGHHTEESKKAISMSSIGRIDSEEIREKKSITKIGKNNPQYGIPRSEDFKEFMRKALSGENSYRFDKKSSNSSSKYLGAYLMNKRLNYWRAAIGKTIIGNYRSEIDAALAYDNFVRNHNLNRTLNFPDILPD